MKLPIYCCNAILSGGDARVSQTLMARLASLLESHPYPGNSGEGGDFIETLTAGGATSVAKSVAGYCR